MRLAFLRRCHRPQRVDVRPLSSGMMSLRTPFPSTSPTQCQSTFYTATPRRLGKENSSSKPASSIIEEIFDDTRLRRSVLFVPGDKPRALDKIPSLNTDAVILDLEDAVAPSKKEEARTAVCGLNRSQRQRKLFNYLTKNGGPDFGGKEAVPAVYKKTGYYAFLVSRPHRWGRADVAKFADVPAVSALVLPKAESVEEVQEMWKCMERAGASHKTKLWCVIETAKGVTNVDEIAEVGSQRYNVNCLTAGTNDLANSLDIEDTPDRMPLLYSLSRIIVAARANGLVCLDGVHNNVRDLEGFARTAEQGKQLGFDGKTLIHPSTIDKCNEIFSPRKEEVERAQKIIQAWDTAIEEGAGAVEIEGQLVEELHANKARRLVQKAKQIGLA